jgi:oligoribonuclease NrnB/cAMP/cGMP phosphodiesterase (DHH superfamily)
MDGLASAFIAHSSFLEAEEEAEFYPMHYSDVNNVYDIPLNEGDIVYILDFSLPEEMIRELSCKVDHIYIIDHHKTAQFLLNLNINNVTVDFDNNMSGAMLTFDFFVDRGINPLKPELFEYVQDRDLWKWELPGSKEVSAALALMVEKNNIESFKDAYWLFDKSIAEFKNIGTVALKTQQKQVSEKVDKCFDIKLLEQHFKIINATENISEIGNDICNKYDMPSIMFFYTSLDTVVLSFRSLDHLTDVSVIAKEFGGGGHAQSSGATVSSDVLAQILSNKY